MSDRPVVLFMFAGREGNLRVNLPQIERILDENPNVEFHIWNLAREAEDDAYLRSLWSAGRVKVLNDFAGPRPLRHIPKVWHHYTQARYRKHLFVKVDDDCVFIQTEHFGAFVDAVEANPKRILSAEVVNNGACTEFMPELWQQFIALDIPLLDVHQSNAYAAAAHQHLLANCEALTARPLGLADIETWLSINFIGMNWEMLSLVSARIGRRSPARIADRKWGPTARVGDEGACNMFDRAVMTGFTVGHLGFGPQDVTPEQEDSWRIGYTYVANRHMAECSGLNIL